MARIHGPGGLWTAAKAVPWRVFTFRVVLLLGLLLPTVQKGASQTPAVEPGMRLRVSAEGLGIQELIGPLARINADSVQVGGLRLAIDSITRVERSVGNGTYVARGLGLGFLFGVTAGVLVPVAACWGCDGEYALYGPIAGLIVGVPLGLMVGGFWGYSKKREFWTRVPTESLRMFLTPRSGGRLEMGWSVPFGWKDP